MGGEVEPVQEMTHRRCQLGAHQPGVGTPLSLPQTERKTITTSEMVKSGIKPFLALYLILYGGCGILLLVQLPFH